MKQKAIQDAKARFSVILDARLTSRTYVLGDTYTIVDMAAWGWARMLPFILGDLAWTTLPNLKRWFDVISARPAAAGNSM
jgi:GST-like protein